MTASRWLTTGVAGLVLVLAAGPLAAQGKVQKISKKLIDRAEDTLKSIGDAEKQLNKVTERYDKLVAGKSVNDRRKEHQKLSDALEDMQNRAKDVREKSRDMEKESSEFFKQWDKSLDDIKDGELRRLSRESLSQSQQGYGQVVATARNVANQYDAFVTTLGNQLKFLDVDLSDNAIAKLKSSSQDPQGTARDLRTHVASLKAEINRYVAAMK